MVTTAVIVPSAGGVTEDGTIMQVDFVGSPEHVSATAELKPPVELTFTLNIPDDPCLIASTPDCEVVKPKPGCAAVTVPVKATVCGLEESPSTMDTVAVSGVVEAVNTTPRVQDIPAGMEVPQVVLVTTKSVAAAAGVGLVIVALVKGIAALVLFV